VADDDRERWTLTFRELGAAELLERYRRKNELPPRAIDALRDELKLRGVDPDSLRATVPRAEPDPEEPGASGEDAQGEARGEMQPPPEFELPETRTGEVSANVMICPHCQTPNHPESQRCRSCRELLRPDEGRAAPDQERIGPAVIGLFGIVLIVFALYVLLVGDRPVVVGLVAALAGCGSVLASLLLQRGTLARG